MVTEFAAAVFLITYLYPKHLLAFGRFIVIEPLVVLANTESFFILYGLSVLVRITHFRLSTILILSLFTE